jgi:hypothetical protein
MDVIRHLHSIGHRSTAALSSMHSQGSLLSPAAVHAPLHDASAAKTAGMMTRGIPVLHIACVSIELSQYIRIIPDCPFLTAHTTAHTTHYTPLTIVALPE